MDRRTLLKNGIYGLTTPSLLLASGCVNGGQQPPSTVFGDGSSKVNPDTDHLEPLPDSEVREPGAATPRAACAHLTHPTRHPDRIARSALARCLDQPKSGPRQVQPDEGHHPHHGSPRRQPPAFLTDTNERAAAARLEEVRKYHTENNGWADIGYHYIIDPAGRLWQGRLDTQQGAHVRDNNAHNLGIMVLGNYNHQRPNDAQLNMLQRAVVAFGQRHKGEIQHDSLAPGNHAYRMPRHLSAAQNEQPARPCAEDTGIAHLCNSPTLDVLCLFRLAQTGRGRHSREEVLYFQVNLG